MSFGQTMNFLKASPSESVTLISGLDIPRRNLCAIGDSRTNQNHYDPYPGNYRFSQGFIDQAMSYTREMYRWRQENNLGINGDTALGIYNRRADVLSPMDRRPAHEEWDLVYWAGGNDMIGGITSASFLSNFRLAMKYFMQRFSKIYVIGETPYPMGYGGESSGTHAARIVLAKEYNAGMADYCSKNDNLIFVDTYGLYGSAGDPDVSNSDHNNGTDIHPGAIGASVLGRALAGAMIKARGLPAFAPGKVLSPNPSLIDCELITSGTQQNNFYCSAKGAGVTLSRPAGVDALKVAIDSTGGTPYSFNMYNDTVAFSDPLMPGDVVQGCLDVEYLSVTGKPLAPYMYIDQSNGGGFAHANNTNPDPLGYSKGLLLGCGRQVYMTDPFLIPSGIGAGVMQPYLVSGALANTALEFLIYELSCRRVYVSPNAEYSAIATIPIHRKNIKALTGTAGAGFALTLRSLYNYDDGEIIRVEDADGEASAKNVTLTCSGSDVIKNNGTTSATKILSTDYGVISLRADRGSNAFVVI